MPLEQSVVDAGLIEATIYSANLDKVQRVVEAFTKHPLTEHERQVVQLMLDNPGLSSEALTREAGWRGQA